CKGGAQLLPPEGGCRGDRRGGPLDSGAEHVYLAPAAVCRKTPATPINPSGRNERFPELQRGRLASAGAPVEWQEPGRPGGQERRRRRGRAALPPCRTWPAPRPRQRRLDDCPA